MNEARMPVPELPTGLEWVNTLAPPTMAAMRGRVVLINFWTYDSINCLHALADLRFLENKYHDGLSVIGVHTPKYTQQRSGANVLKAVNRNHIRHAVASDPNFVIWQQYGIASWPTVAVIDPDGLFVGSVAGEDRRAELDALIGELLDEASTRDARVYESPPPVQRAEAKLMLSFPAKLLATETSLFIADTAHNRILETSHEGRVLRQFGSGNQGYWDGRGSDAGFSSPHGLVMIKDALYVADTGNHAVRRIRLLGAEVETMVGTGVQGRGVGKDMPSPNEVAINSPTDLVAHNERLFITMSGQHQVWQLDLGRNVVGVFAGSGKMGTDDGEPMAATFAQPSGICAIGNNLIVADAAASAIRTIQINDGRVHTLLGMGLYEFGDQDGPPLTARLQNPLAVCAEPRSTNVFVADSYNGKIKSLNTRTGEIRTLALPYRFHEASGLSFAAGALWVANTNAHEIVRVDVETSQVRRVPIGD